MFSLESFSKLYADYHGNFDAKEFAKRLWGNVYLHSNRAFRSKPEHSGDSRTFVSFILEPLYKIYAHVLGSEGKELQAVLSEIGVYLKKEEYKLDIAPLLKLVLGRFFGDTGCFTSMAAAHFPSPIDGAKAKVPHIYSGKNTDLHLCMCLV